MTHSDRRRGHSPRVKRGETAVGKPLQADQTREQGDGSTPSRIESTDTVEGIDDDADLSSLFVDGAARVKQLQKRKDELESRIADLESVVKDRDARVEALDRQVQKMTKTIRLRARHAAQSQSQLKAERIRIRELQAKVAELEYLNYENGNIVAELKSEHSERVLELEQRIEDQEVDLGNIARLERTNEELQDSLHQAHLNNAATEERIMNMYKSDGEVSIVWTQLTTVAIGHPKTSFARSKSLGPQQIYRSGNASTRSRQSAYPTPSRDDRQERCCHTPRYDVGILFFERSPGRHVQSGLCEC